MSRNSIWVKTFWRPRSFFQLMVFVFPFFVYCTRQEKGLLRSNAVASILTFRTGQPFCMPWSVSAIRALSRKSTLPVLWSIMSADSKGWAYCHIYISHSIFTFHTVSSHFTQYLHISHWHLVNSKLYPLDFTSCCHIDTREASKTFSSQYIPKETFLVKSYEPFASYFFALLTLYICFR